MQNNGLNNNEVVESRKKYGTNSLNYHHKNTFLKLFLESLGDPIIKILLIALGIKLLFLFQDFDWYETIGIVASILIASLVSTISEYGSEAAFSRLQEESSKIKTKVKRNNEIQEVFIDDIVVGDLVILTSGDKVPADGKIIEGELMVDESSLNGESKESEKSSTHNSQIYRGSVIYSGEAVMLVEQVGVNTEYGKIAEELQEKQPDSPLKIRLRGLAEFISKIGYIGAILVSISYLFNVIFIANNFEHELILATITDFHTMFSHVLYALTLSVTIIVVAVPEGLPMMITLVLSSNMKKMLKDQVLVRKLVGIETSGSLNVLLTDKTGTLTKGQLEVIGFMDSECNYYQNEEEIINKSSINNIIRESIIYNNSGKYNSNNEVIGGNITDQALLKFITNKNEFLAPIIHKKPFNSQDKYAQVTIKKEHEITYIKGAPEIIINKCTKMLLNTGEIKYQINHDKLIQELKKATSKGIRVIALAYTNYSSLKQGLTFIGFILIRDELRPETIPGIKTITEAGIRTIMITGDDLDTAIAIAKEANIINSSKDIAITHKELEQLNDEQILKIYPNLKVIARSLPSDKSRLVKVLQKNNLIVGMTGDGVNDAPALKKADVGFAMGSGTEVSKEAADIVILDDNILSISNAILYGRTIFKSIRKFIIFQLTVNMCALVLSIVGPFIGVNTPVTIIQMLWINMIMDTFAGIAFSFEPALKEYMQEPPKSKDEPIINSYMYGEIFFTGLYSAILCILFLKLPIFKHLIRTSNNYQYLMTAYFALFIFMGLFNAFNARTERLNLLAHIKQNKVFLTIIIFIVSVQTYLIYFGGDLFRTYGLTIKELILVLILAISVIPFDWIRKIYIRKNRLVSRT